MLIARLCSLCLCLLLALSALPVRGQAASPDDAFVLARALLIDASIRADTVGIEHTLHRLEALAAEAQGMAEASHAAQVQYHLGFARLQLLNNTYRGREDAVRLADEALAHFKQAIVLDEALPEAHALAIMTTWSLFRLAPERAPTLGPELGRLMQHAQSLGTEAPSLALIDGMNTAFDPNGPARPEGIARLEEALTLFEQQRPQQPIYPDWWTVGAYAWVGQVYLAMDPPAVDKARDAFEHALRLRPDYRLVKTRLLPMTEPVKALAPGRFAGFPWHLLATDAEADGRNPTLADGKALHYHYDARTDSLWFKFDLHRLPDPDAFGINLVFDTDRDQATGGAWWGGNTAFTYDRAVTLWVTRLAPGRYRGTIGIASHRGAQRGQFTHLAQNNIAFAVDVPHQTLIVGFKRSDLGPVEAVDVIGAVGSNLVWNDDLMDTGSGTVIMER